MSFYSAQTLQKGHRDKASALHSAVVLCSRSSNDLIEKWTTLMGFMGDEVISNDLIGKWTTFMRFMGGDISNVFGENMRHGQVLQESPDFCTAFGSEAALWRIFG